MRSTGVSLMSELVGFLRRALTQQAPVRASLYAGLSRIAQVKNVCVCVGGWALDQEACGYLCCANLIRSRYCTTRTLFAIFSTMYHGFPITPPYIAATGTTLLQYSHYPCQTSYCSVHPVQPTNPVALALHHGSFAVWVASCVAPLLALTVPPLATLLCHASKVVL